MISINNSRKNRDFVLKMPLNGKIFLIRNRSTNSKIIEKKKTGREYQ